MTTEQYHSDQTVTFFIELRNIKNQIWEVSEEFETEEQAINRMNDLLSFNDWVSFDQIRVAKAITTKFPVTTENLKIMNFC